MFIAGIICEVLQSRAFLTDLLEMIISLTYAAIMAAFGPVILGYALASSLGWFEQGIRMFAAGCVLSAIIPLAIYAVYYFLGIYIITSFSEWFDERKKEDNVLRLLGIHVICLGVVIALCTARLIPEIDGFRFNSMGIPVVLYVFWLVFSSYYEDGWWFDGWNKSTRSRW